MPQLTNFYHLEALKRFIEKNQLDVLILDPTYPMLAGIKDDASNMFSMGPLLKNLGDLSNEFGCTPILCHHFKKTKENPFEPAELEDIAWAGFWLVRCHARDRGEQSAIDVHTTRWCWCVSVLHRTLP